MVIDVEFDLLDTAVEEGTVSTWFVEEGESVDEGDILLEVVTDEDTYEIRAPAAGVVVELRVEEDETVRVGDVVCLLDTSDAMDFAADEDEDETYDDDEDEI